MEKSNLEQKPGEILTDITARGKGYGVPFKGAVDQLSDLEDLVTTANHEQMHIYMERDGLNLAGTCEALGILPENLVQTLTNSFEPYVDQGVESGIISQAEKPEWIDRVKTEFQKRVYWTGS